MLMENSMDYEYRAEIISNQSVQDDVVELLEQEIPGLEYTVFPEVHGCGRTQKKLGDTVWPEMNFVLFAYTDIKGAKKIKACIAAVKKKFPQEGITLFFSKGEQI